MPQQDVCVSDLNDVKTAFQIVGFQYIGIYFSFLSENDLSGGVEHHDFRVLSAVGKDDVQNILCRIGIDLEGERCVVSNAADDVDVDGVCFGQRATFNRDGGDW